MKRAWWREKSASEKATLIARGVGHAALGIIALRLWVPAAGFVTAGSFALGASAIALLLALALAARDADGIARPLYAGVALATLGGVLSQLYNLVAYVLPARQGTLPNPSLWLLVAGVNPMLAATFALVIGRRRRQALRLPELLDVVLVATAAAVVALMIAQLSPARRRARGR